MAETCTIVVDVGESCVKAGYAGDDVPCAMFPPVLMKHSSATEYYETHDNTNNNDNNDGLQLNNPINRGIVRDWDQMERLWQRIMDRIGLSSPDSASVLIIENNNNINNNNSSMNSRSQWAELLFEKSVPSVCFASSAPLALFSSGRTTGIIIIFIKYYV